MPVTSKNSPSTAILVTVISFWVKVPVLSEQIIVADPRVSTEESFRISALRAIISCMPKARVMVTTAGNPSGTAAIARLTAMMNISRGGVPVSMPSTKTAAQITRVTHPRVRPNLSSRFCRGVLSSSTSWSMVAIWPISVAIPVFTTTPTPLP